MDLNVQNLSTEIIYELAELYFMRGQFSRAIEKLNLVSSEAERTGRDDLLLEASLCLLRIYAERDEVHSVDQLQQKLQARFLSGKIQPTSKSFYTLALCADFQKRYTEALEHLEQALALAVANQQNRDLAYALFGLARVLRTLKSFDSSNEKLAQLKTLLEVLKLPSLEISYMFLQTNVLREQKKYDECLDCLNRVSDLNIGEKSFLVSLILNVQMGLIYIDKQDFTYAKIYLDLARRNIDVTEQVRLAKTVDRLLESIGASPVDADLILQSSAHRVIERHRGSIDFRNQFILLELLRVFVRRPGHVFSKEDLVQMVWHEPYRPDVHDNKIYVTIKRLRQMIEPDLKKPRYIYRAKEGYFLSQSAKVELQH